MKKQRINRAKKKKAQVQTKAELLSKIELDAQSYNIEKDTLAKEKSLIEARLTQEKEALAKEKKLLETKLNKEIEALIKERELIERELKKEKDILANEKKLVEAELNSARLKYRNVTQKNREYNEELKSISTKYETALSEINLEKEHIAALSNDLTELKTVVGDKDSILSVNQAVTQSLQSEQDHLKMEFLRARLALHDLRHELHHKEAELSQHKIRAAKLKNTLSYQLGHTLIFSTKSWKNFLTLPAKLWQIRRLAAERRMTMPAQQLLSYQPTEAAGFTNRTEILHLESAIESLVIDTKDGLAKALKQLKVASIMDEFTFLSYEPECNLLQLTPQHWEQELTTFQPELLFIESAWRGKNDLWGSKVGHMSQEVVNIAAWCRKNKVPTIFWNKEDPVHFETFLNTAKLFDYIFTTDIDCISRYKSALGHDRVYFLPFAAQPMVNNPIEKYERKDAFCFAGAYYVKYPERTRDLGDFLLSLPDFKPVEIYDRNYGKDDPNYQFPAEYQPFIVGTLPYSEIDRAYKGYYYSINLNSIKQSQSMFARRVFELLASNTVTVSNFSRGIRAMFGDLVFTSDSGRELVSRLSKIAGNPLKVKLLRLQALRKVMMEHTYQDRLAYVYSKVSNCEPESLLPQVTVIGYARSIEECVTLIQSFTRQHYENKTLTIVTINGLDTSGLELEDNITLVNASQAEEIRLKDACMGTWLSAMVTDDYYGPYYLTDLLLATRYTDARVIGKGAFYKIVAGELQLNHSDAIYKNVEYVAARRSIAFGAVIPDSNLRDWTSCLYTHKYMSDSVFSVDEFGYCMEGKEEVLEYEEFQENILANGYSLAEINSISEQAKPDQVNINALPMLRGSEILEILNPPKSTSVSAIIEHGQLVFNSSLPDNKHEYWYAKVDYKPEQLNVVNGQFHMYLDTTPGLNIQFVLQFLDDNKTKITHAINLANRNVAINIPEGTCFVRLGLRIYASGSAVIGGLILDKKPMNISAQLVKSDTLVLTNNYPSYSDLYKNGFVHSRVKSYLERGCKCDIFRFKRDEPVSYHEFENIDIITGGEAILQKTIASTGYKTILVHFLDEHMWSVLEPVIDHVNVIVWVHGAEIHPWYRRNYNYTNDQQREAAKKSSEIRMAFWRRILNPMHPNLKMVFVSNYFAEEVMEDIGFRLPEDSYTVIHNPIDMAKFNYIEKPAAQRTKILSIRPFASRQYANDLSVSVITKLKDKPFFNKLQFHIIGDGPLFDETLQPLIGLENVSLERRFVNHDEISALHKQYGIFLCPTRWDSHGVSRDEAMSSGLVPFTSAVAAIPEFVDEECAVYDDGENVDNLVAGIERLYHSPDLFVKMSKNASNQVFKKCNKEMIIARELELFHDTNC